MEDYEDRTRAVPTEIWDIIAVRRDHIEDFKKDGDRVVLSTKHHTPGFPVYNSSVTLVEREDGTFHREEGPFASAFDAIKRAICFGQTSTTGTLRGDPDADPSSRVFEKFPVSDI